MNIQEQEERDYMPRSELQNAYSMSQIEFQDDSGKVQDLLNQGFYVIVEQSTAYCHRTDAILGMRTTYLDHCASLRRATLAAADYQDSEESCIVVRHPSPLPIVTIITDDEIPF